MSEPLDRPGRLLPERRKRRGLAVLLLRHMAQPDFAMTQPDIVSAEPVTDDKTWRDVEQLLREAARLATERGAPSDQFMQAAWAACLGARPGLREELADKELRAQLKKLRKRGLIPVA
jgi:hypothetical protein